MRKNLWYNKGWALCKICLKVKVWDWVYPKFYCSPYKTDCVYFTERELCWCGVWTRASRPGIVHSSHALHTQQLNSTAPRLNSTELKTCLSSLALATTQQICYGVSSRLVSLSSSHLSQCPLSTPPRVHSPLSSVQSLSLLSDATRHHSSWR